MLPEVGELLVRFGGQNAVEPIFSEIFENNLHIADRAIAAGIKAAPTLHLLPRKSLPILLRQGRPYMRKMAASYAVLRVFSFSAQKLCL
jgi:hypothetical protein